MDDNRLAKIARNGNQTLPGQLNSLQNVRKLDINITLKYKTCFRKRKKKKKKNSRTKTGK